jgi:uncharacterized RDD family membrane protein YckC
MAISIETTQNVTIDYDVASIGDRVIGAIIDNVIQVAYVVLMVWLLTRFEPGPAILVIAALPYFLYNLLCEIFLDGQSFGKKALRMKVVKLDGTQPSIGAYILRWVLRLVDQTFFIGLLVLAINGKGQRLGDIAAGTTVIKLRPRLSLSETLMPEVEEQYVPTYTGVTRLTDRDVAIIREVWSAGRKLSNHETLDALAARVATVIGVDTPANPNAFLEQVMQDYAYYTQ